MGDLLGAGGQPSSGGVTGTEQSYAQYVRAQQDIANAQAFAGKGMGPSTGETQADAGAAFGEAKQLAQISDQQAAAQAALKNQAQQAGKSNVAGVTSAAGGLLGGK